MGFNSFHFCKSLWNRITWSARDNKLKMAYYSEKLIHCTINFIFLKLIFLTEAITVYCADDHTTSVWSLIHGAVCFDQWSENEDETIYLYFLNGSNHTLVLISEASTFTYILKAYRSADNHSFFYDCAKAINRNNDPFFTWNHYDFFANNDRFYPGVNESSIGYE